LRHPEGSAGGFFGTLGFLLSPAKSGLLLAAPA
jgi:hypothetical protein